MSFNRLFSIHFIAVLTLLSGCKSELDFSLPSQSFARSDRYFAPRALSLNVLSSSSIQLDWEESLSGSESGYKIAYIQDGEAPIDCQSGTVIESQDITGTSHLLNSLDPLHSYSFRICSIDSLEQENSSQTVSSEVLRPTKIYRSVGPGNTNALATGSLTDTVNISDGVAYFSTGLPDNVGVGDALLIDRNENEDFDSADEVVFIYEREPTASPSNTIYKVRTVDGEVPDDLNTNNYWSIYRAYTQASAAESGNENAGIDMDLRNFDTWIDGVDMVSVDQQWEFAIYGDGANGTLRFRDWVSSPAHYLRLFAPYKPTEVGETQRHSGQWDDTKARFVSSDYFGTINNENEETPFNHLRLDGLLVENTRSDGTGNGAGLNFDDFDQGPDINGELYVENCFVRKTNGHWPGVEKAGLWVNVNRISKVVVVNNVFDGFSRGIRLGTNDNLIVEVYNNTIVNSAEFGIMLLDGAANETYRIKNNLIVNSGQDFDVRPNVTVADYSNNLSSDSTAVGTDSVTNSIITFVDSAAQNYHLDSSDTDAIAQGADLSSNEPNYSFNKDIKGLTRTSWDVGAFSF